MDEERCKTLLSALSIYYGRAILPRVPAHVNYNK